MNLCVVTATDIEFNTVARLYGATSAGTGDPVRMRRGETAAHQLTLLFTSVGAPGFDTWLRRHLGKTRYDAVLIAGLGGALAPDLKIGAALVYEGCFLAPDGAPETIPHGLPYVSCDGQTSAMIQTIMQSAGMDCASVRGITTDHIVTRARDKQRLYQVSGAAVVDMESHVILNVCREAGIPAAVLRVISDEATRDMPDFNRALDAGGRMSNGAAALAMLQKPVAAAHFLRGLRPAIRAFERAVSLVLSTPWSVKAETKR